MDTTTTEASQQAESSGNVTPVSRTARRREQRRRQKEAALKAAAEEVSRKAALKEAREKDARRQRLRQLIAQKQGRRQGGGQEILVPAPVPGELSPEELQQYQRKMQKLVNHRGRGALMDHLGVADKKTKVELAKAMMQKDTDAMNRIMRQVHNPDEDPDLDK